MTLMHPVKSLSPIQTALSPSPPAGPSRRLVKISVMNNFPHYFLRDRRSCTTAMRILVLLCFVWVQKCWEPLTNMTRLKNSELKNRFRTSLPLTANFLIKLQPKSNLKSAGFKRLIQKRTSPPTPEYSSENLLKSHQFLDFRKNF